ncbi:cobalt-precorrin 5A hydrolase [Pseudobacteriovorax antillogorgiicola]|uniref:Cobalt-precorrin 5A acetaldehyde-lyase n=1 Tax=Pseudobacteriovorax antillogorgiicola TaxID=1513793 RepID=A0A1Y6C2M1_9BACT|nr:cobalamin biosynthesis protein [Pseudobacteriovorax antillogorgiicola]TCS50677.1 cobalt-precorrin 5A acetaldehyde-lyase [Pseudobacteriovorax antillogorgiicola]SMF40084.1 cobalt-precorrin 5A acetaldehyde-lyase [Pseudobacteriovorax antillogorgiicola]
MSLRKPFAIYGITKHGLKTAARIKAAFPEADLYVSKKLMGQAPADSLELPLPFSPLLRETFPAYDCHIFVVSVGAVVRMIAPLLQNKKTDPSVLCIDDANRFTICLLSGHVGRGNEFTSRVAEALGNQAVITTASDSIGTLTVDILGRKLGWVLEDDHHNVTRGCAAVVNEERVLIVQETGEPDFWPLDKKLPPGVDYCHSLDHVPAQTFDMHLIVSDRDIPNLYPYLYRNAVVYRPKSLILGIGCDRGTPFELLERGIHGILKEFKLSWKSIKGLATISIKADEPGLVELGKRYNWPLIAYEPKALDDMEGVENPSELVKKYTGSRTVAEGAALKRSGATSLLVSKQKYTEPNIAKNMTLAICRLPFDKRN